MADPSPLQHLCAWWACRAAPCSASSCASASEGGAPLNIITIIMVRGAGGRGGKQWQQGSHLVVSLPSHRRPKAVRPPELAPDAAAFAYPRATISCRQVHDSACGPRAGAMSLTQGVCVYVCRRRSLGHYSLCRYTKSKPSCSVSRSATHRCTVRCTGAAHTHTRMHTSC